MIPNKFNRLVERGLITAGLLEEVLRQSEASGRPVEEFLLDMGVPKYEILFSLTGYYGCPFAEYDEDVVVSRDITRGLDMERLKKDLWLPVSVKGGSAEVIAYLPDSPVLQGEIKRALGVSDIKFMVALPHDITRMVENNQDLNPKFPPPAGRTPLAKTRTFLANRRSQLAFYRTELARGRTGLAFLRTGISFITIAVMLYRIFGLGYLVIAEAVLLISGIAMAVDGLTWYLPARKAGSKRLDCRSTEPTWGTTVLETLEPGAAPAFTRTGGVDGSAKLRESWDNLAPVMRRRFLASDRTDMAEERTTLACYRTAMARARTGLSFTRTGIAFIGLGVAFLRYFHAGPWTAFDFTLILLGILMSLEGFHWYIPGRRAGVEGHLSVMASLGRESIWDFVFPPVHKRPDPEDFFAYSLPVKGSHAPGIWATTGLALERTVLADRRNVMARLRTTMARSRTGMAFVRTGMVMSSVGMGLLVYFGAKSAAWTALDIMLILTGAALIADGLFWHIPAEKVRRQFPYCFADIEITIPDYGSPSRHWKKAVFSHDDI
jgi:uncharacterized membrane protein YidH (DUF202 family)